jgi:murein DD-endopeptidase / murein LD-carboxypeptidase
MNILYKYYLSRKWFLLALLLILFWAVCRHLHKLTPYQAEHITTIKTGKTTPYQLVSYACTLEGTPYLYASTDPHKGFDCSGFVTYVFKHFDIAVPRVSTDFTPVQRPVPLKDAKMGDLILFTGSDSTDRVVGHMGIISSIPGEPLRFIHSSSGKSRGVVETDFHTEYYEVRYIKTIRVFRQNDQPAPVGARL